MTFSISCFFIVFILLVLVEVLNGQDIRFTPEVQTKLGPIRGLVEKANGIDVDFFQGIRYAQAERFAKPRSIEKWEGVYDATTVRYACPQVSEDLKPGTGNEQFNVTQPVEYYHEDCLYLNIWRPSNTKPHIDPTRPVMIWIYGGSFANGDIFESYYNARYLSAIGDVIVVSINYRLSSFGFLYSGNENAPGNLGLWDQLLALKWVKDHIHDFHGDPNKITIFGESAGSMSVGNLLITPQTLLNSTTSLFKRAIMQSGSPTSSDFIDSKQMALGKFTKYVAKLNCSNDDSNKSVECLKTKKMEDLVKATYDLDTFNLFVPIYGDTFLPTHPIELVNKFSKSVDVLFGIVENEGSYLVRDNIIAKYAHQEVVDMNNFIMLLNKTVSYFKVTNKEEIVQFYSQYISHNSTSKELKKVLANAWGDYMLACPQILFGTIMAQLRLSKASQHFYSYKFNHPTNFSDCNQDWMGTCHFAEVLYLFGMPHAVPQTATDLERQLSTDIMRSWSVFAHTGRPMPIGHAFWYPALAVGHPNSLEYLDIRVGASEIGINMFNDRCAFWRSRIFDAHNKN